MVLWGLLGLGWLCFSLWLYVAGVFLVNLDDGRYSIYLAHIYLTPSCSCPGETLRPMAICVK